MSKQYFKTRTWQCLLCKAMSLALARPSECGALRPTVENFDEWPPIIADVTCVQQTAPSTNFSLHTCNLNYAFQLLSNKHTETCRLNKAGSGGSRLAQAPQILLSPQFLIGSIVILLSRCCLPNVEGEAPKYFFHRTATESRSISVHHHNNYIRIVPALSFRSSV